MGSQVEIVSACPPKSDVRLSRKIMEDLSGRIRGGIYLQGSRLPAERDLAVEMGVSRPVIREALMGLELLGTVSVRVGSGTYVNAVAPTPSVVDCDLPPFELLAAIQITEAGMIAGVCRDITPAAVKEIQCAIDGLNEAVADFHQWHDRLGAIHQRLAAQSGNTVIAAVIHRLWEARCKNSALMNLLGAGGSDSCLRMSALLKQLIQAIALRNAQGACAALRKYHEASMDAALSAFSDLEIRKAEESIGVLRNRYLP